MSKDFIVKISEKSERASDFLKVFGTLEVPVLSPIPVLATTPHGREPNFLLDLEAIEPEQRERLIEHLASRFDIPVSEVRNIVDEHGVPIPDRDCMLMIHHPQKWVD